MEKARVILPQRAHKGDADAGTETGWVSRLADRYSSNGIVIVVAWTLCQQAGVVCSPVCLVHSMRRAITPPATQASADRAAT